MQKQRCIIIGSSPETDIDVIARCLRGHDFIACADGGYVYARKLGLRPDLIAGDFDSSERPKNIAGRIITLPRAKDDTDTMYIVRECVEMGFEEFLLFGCTGGRLDHTAANFCILQYLSKLGKYAEMIDSENRIFVMSEGVHKIDNMKGCTFSIFPFGCGDCTVTLQGFEYELENGVLYSDFPLGVSNTVISESASVNLMKGNALIIISIVD